MSHDEVTCVVERAMKAGQLRVWIEFVHRREDGADAEMRMEQ